MVNPYTGTVRNPPSSAHEGGINEYGQAIRCGYRLRDTYLYACPCGKAIPVSGAALNAGKIRCTTVCKGRTDSRECQMHRGNCYPERYGCWVKGVWMPAANLTFADKFRVQVVSAVIIDRSGTPRILLAQRKQNVPFARCWESPGGKIEHGETPGYALMREIVEELDVGCTLDREIGCAILNPPQVATPLKVTFYLTQLNGKPRPVTSDRLCMFPAEELERLPLMPANRALLPQVIQEMTRR